LQRAERGDVVLLHGCCHNPTGADLSREQWDRVIDLLEERGLVPFIDVAYQGFAEGIDEDAYGIRASAARLPELVVVSSCSKNFGLYRDRVGCTSIVAQSNEHAQTSVSHLANVTRRVYSMPPAHGAEVVQIILNDAELTRLWLSELGTMRDRVNNLRRQFAEMLATKTGTDRFAFIAQQRGMFSLLGLDKAQIQRLRDEFHIYIVGSSRANIAGVSEANLDYLTDSIAAVL
ncbi:MAG: aminotransferase class I/II-fold pyridoxal phosphate-dependent enzyme, partial [Gammaproteobacteria bacterium]|nr:aminotransferase class I/II-fold pyridoxal phosphate-dependent enzyme [Gammaproteobacteria bacterium]